MKERVYNFSLSFDWQLLRTKEVYSYIIDKHGVRVGEISRSLDIPISTTKRIITKLLENNLIEKHGKGAGTNYEMK